MDITCPDCGETKPDSDYYRDKSRTNGRHLYCKVCARRRSAERYRKRNACAREYHVRGSQPPKTSRCEQCGAEYKPWSDAARFCSKACANTHNGKQRRTSDARRQPVQVMLGSCAVCSTMFVPRNGRAKTCSTECGREFRLRLWKDKQHRRRAKIRGATAERISREAIFARDEWTCGICREPIDPAAKHPDMGSPSLDHILPISRGGTHTLDNVQAAHLGCNLSKGARVPESAVKINDE